MTSKQLYGFTKDKACERSAWKRLWGTRNIELEGKYFSSLDYCSHATFMRLQPNASAAWAAQFIPVTGEQYSISSPPWSPPHWHWHKLTVQSICACNDLCKSNPSMCTQKKVPACFQQLFSVKSGHKITTNQSPLLLFVRPPEAAATPSQPPSLSGAPYTCAAEHTRPQGKASGHWEK